MFIKKLTVQHGQHDDCLSQYWYKNLLFFKITNILLKYFKCSNSYTNHFVPRMSVAHLANINNIIV